ncbi:hypothetical protein FOZ61_003784 [Perkinsus olseni]|uniref:Uncharacterized protein n=1 Tax=Perkinsus olseni TaxID=32597 RepID=A0A7J6MTT3_PEROL|nr:hypothetical protein FOZ61_003784 [Perkinsus olseni]KAF4675002.1 hypothetical protein FOL46_003170 [Perkinsus olseni]
MFYGWLVEWWSVIASHPNVTPSTPYPLGEYDASDTELSGSLTFFEGFKFDMDIFLHDCPITVFNLRLTLPKLLPDETFGYGIPFNYDSTALPGAVEACEDDRIKISDFDEPMTFVFVRKQFNEIQVTWGGLRQGRFILSS